METLDLSPTTLPHAGDSNAAPAPEAAAPESPHPVGTLLTTGLGYLFTQFVTLVVVIAVVSVRIAPTLRALPRHARLPKGTYLNELADPAIATLILALGGLTVVGFFLLLESGKRRPVRRSLGLLAPAGGAAAVITVVLGALGAQSVGAALAERSEALHLLPQTRPDFIARAFTTASTGSLVGLALAMGFFPAISEELMCRGYLQRNLLRCWPVGRSMVATALFFSAMHGSPATILSTLPFSAWAGYAAWRTRSIVPGMVAHFAVNTTAGMFGVFSSPATRALTTEPLPWWQSLLFLVGGALVFAFAWRAFEHVMRDHPGGEPVRDPAPALPAPADA